MILFVAIAYLFNKFTVSLLGRFVSDADIFRGLTNHWANQNFNQKPGWLGIIKSGTLYLFLIKIS